MNTSIESYREAKASGLINRVQLEILEYMAEHGLVTQGEVTRHFNDTSRTYAPRFSPLEEAGVIRCVGMRRDHFTGRDVKEYQPTGAIPTEPIKSSSKPVKTCARCAELEAEVERLVKKISAMEPQPVLFRVV